MALADRAGNANVRNEPKQIRKISRLPRSLLPARSRRGGMVFAVSWLQCRKSPILAHELAAMPLNNALVPMAPLQQTPPIAAERRALSGFIAHLIATAAQDPQTRARRRADPQVALAAYEAMGQWPSKNGRLLSRRF